MDSNPGPDTILGGHLANNDLSFFDTAFTSGISKTARGIVHKLQLSLEPNFTFVLPRNKGKSAKKHGSEPKTGGMMKEGAAGMIGTTTTAASMSTMSEATTAILPLSGPSMSEYRGISSSSDEDPDGGVLLQDSLRPLNQQEQEASSLVSPIPSSNHTSSPGQGSASLSLAPLHFHRKTHHGQHERHQSLAPGPFTCAKTRKYKLLHLPDRSQGGTHNEHSNINDLANGFGQLAIQPPARSWIYTPTDAQVILDRYYGKCWRAAEIREAENKYRGIDMNEGWNRDAATLIQSTKDSMCALRCKLGGPEIGIKIKELMNRFSFWAQLEPIEWEADELKGIFDMVFVGDGLGNSGWARKPGSWWATRKKLFDGHRGRTFLEELDLWMEEIEDGREKWKRENKGKSFVVSSLKRKMSTVTAEAAEYGVAGVAGVALMAGRMAEEGDMHRKRVKLPKVKSEQVMSEEWRARRRSQEKKAGRWTDGTLRMDRMWEEFYWVLNEDDPDDEAWPREVFTRAYLY